MKMLVLCCLMLAAAVTAYPQGPPEDACMSMFPTGHQADAMNSMKNPNPTTRVPPYTLSVSGGPIRETNQTLTVTLTVQGVPDFSYFEGMFVQARLASCYNDKPVGTFYIDASDDFLKVMNCHEDRPKSAVSQNLSRHVDDSKVFYWLSPASQPGHVFFRATVVKNKTTFWTNVVSDIVRDVTDDAPIPDDEKPVCDICSTTATCAASSFAAVTSLVVAAFGLCLFRL